MGLSQNQRSDGGTLHRRRSGATGIYRCNVPDQNEEQLNLYVGVYTTNTGGYSVLRR